MRIASRFHRRTSRPSRGTGHRLGLAALLASLLASFAGHATPIPGLELTYRGVVTDISAGGSVTVDVPSRGSSGNSLSGSIAAVASAFAFTPPVENLPGGGTYLHVAASAHAYVRFELFIEIIDPDISFDVTLGEFADSISASFGTANAASSAFFHVNVSVECSGFSSPACANFGGRTAEMASTCDTTVLDCQSRQSIAYSPALLFAAGDVGGRHAYIDIFGWILTDASANSYTCIESVCSYGLGIAAGGVSFEVKAIPEPPSLLLFASAPLLLAMTRHRSGRARV